MDKTADGQVMNMKRRGCLHTLFVLLAAILIAAGFWYFENNVIDAGEIVFSSARLPESFDGFRVVVVSDLHGKEFGTDNTELTAAVAAAEPDLIALTGDLCDENSDPEAAADVAGQLATLAPTYYVSGNHEWVMEDPWGFFQMLEETGVTVLHNTYETLSVDDETIVLAGVDDPNGPWDQKTPEQLVTEIRAELGDPYILMLAHRNEQLDLWSELKVDTVLCGHGHGGIIRLPFVGGVLGQGRQLFPEYTNGLYTEGRTNMVVSRGLGNSGLPFRLFNRPHLPVVVLESNP